MSAEMNILNELEKQMYLFNIGEHFESYRFFGSKKRNEDNKDGWRFTVWAPNAKSVSLVGDFSDWKPIEMHRIGKTGGWSVFTEDAKEGQCYKYYIEDKNGKKKYKIDPYSFAYEVPPKDASVILDMPDKKWKDGRWQANKKRKAIYQKPLNIYEVHFSSWKKHEDGSWYSFKDLAEALIPYVKEMGYTHIEFMPLMEHPLEASWGYQITGYYAVAARYGNLLELREFVEEAHKEGIGVIMDWVPGHFCRNDYALSYFDGTPTFEYADPNRGVNNRWGTLNFDLGKSQVHSFLISNAIFWLEEFHLDGIRVDAVSNMLYLDYDDGPWTPNEDGSNHNREGIQFLQKMNKKIFERTPDAYMIAEESTAWANVTKPIEMGGLGFNYKWVQAFKDIRKVITIHNIRFQGIFDPVVLSSIFGTGMNIYHEAGVKYYDNVNFLKGGINFSDVVTTVSPSYANEIQTPEFGEGLEGALRYNSGKIRGIINGIDYDINNPETDPKLLYHFSSTDLSGKAKNKAALQERLGLEVNPDIPLITSVGRLTDQKGYQLVQEKAEELLNSRDVQIAILGTGEAEYENSFRYFASEYPDRFSAVIDFDITLAQLMYAGSDLFLMPSAFEPCGLSQMISLRYGTLPIVHETGGLKDTVVPYNAYTGEGTGFTFMDFSGYALLGTIYRALDVYENQPKAWAAMVQTAMSQDFSWKEPAKDYLEIYESLVNE